MSEKIVQLNEEVIKGQIKELVRGSVEETLNELLEAEATSLTQAARYERSEERQGYRSGHYSRNLTTTSGDVTLKVPRLKGISFETAIIERYRRRESSVEEALIEMYLAGVSVRRVEDITEALWGSKVSPSTISELNKKAYVHIEEWRNRPLQGGRYPYVYVDGIYLRRNWGGEYENVSILVAIAVNEDGYREVLGAAEGMYNAVSLETPLQGDSDGLTIEDTLGVDCAALEAVDENIYQDQLSVLVREAVAQLPEKQRTAIEMKYLQGLPLTDVAEKLCISGSRAGQLCKEGLWMIRNSSNAPTLQELLYYDLNLYNGTGLQAWKRTGCSVQEQILIRNEDKVRRRNYDNSREAKIAYCVRELNMTREAAERLFPV